MNVDVFVCYRRYSAQTAKLFKKYALQHRINAEIWYSDCEVYGNYKIDPHNLISPAKCAVLFIDPDFTHSFLDQESSFECITAIEIVEIIKKKLADSSFRIITVYVDRNAAITEKEYETICSLLNRNHVENPKEAAKLISQNNAVYFSTAKDDEDELFFSISRRMLSNEYYSEHTPNGNYYFGIIPTSVDVVLWDSLKNINSSNIYFENTPMTIPLYGKIERIRSDLSYESQNNTMVSLVGTDVILNDETEEKLLSVRYQKIDYKLFYKTLSLWNQFELNKQIAAFDWRSDIYEIPNAMGLAFMVITSDKQLLFTRRSKKRRVRSGEYDCSIVEGLKIFGFNSNGDEYDINDEKYVENEIHRAFCEEVCSIDEGLEIKIYGLVLDKKYGQWNFVGVINTPLSAEEIKCCHSLRDDTFEDNEMEFIPFVDDTGALSLSRIEHKLKVYLGEGIWSMALTAVHASLINAGFNNNQITDMTKRLI